MRSQSEGDNEEGESVSAMWCVAGASEGDGYVALGCTCQPLAAIEEVWVAQVAVDALRGYRPSLREGDV